MNWRREMQKMWIGCGLSVVAIALSAVWPWLWPLCLVMILLGAGIQLYRWPR